MGCAPFQAFQRGYQFSLFGMPISYIPPPQQPRFLDPTRDSVSLLHVAPSSDNVFGQQSHTPTPNHNKGSMTPPPFPTHPAVVAGSIPDQL